MCHQKGDFFMKKKVLSLILALCMIVAPFTVVQVAAAEPTKVRDSGKLQTALASGGSIQLDADIIMSSDEATDKHVWFTVSEKNTILDLNGHTLSLTITEEADTDATDMTKEVLIRVADGASLTVRDSSSGGTISVKETAIGTVKDINGDSKEEYITVGAGITCIEVQPGGVFTLESGTLKNTQKTHEATEVVSNYGTTYIQDGTVTGVTCIANIAPARIGKSGEAICYLEDGNITGMNCNSYKGEPVSGGWSYGIALLGAGIQDGDLSKVDNDGTVLNISGGTITASQAIGTNASSGKYAGFTINMTDGLVDGTESGTGMYLPAIGVTNISGGKVTGAQGIRICAGELNMTGGTLTGTALSDDSDLVAGGSGGTNGALVVGKASNGYVGDIDINISEGAVIENTATAIDDTSVQPTIVVSDKNMAADTVQTILDKDGNKIENATFTYKSTSISVSVDGAEIDGDVVKISNLTQNTTFDGGNTTLQLNNAAVSGDVINRTSGTSLSVDGGSIGGDVENTNKGSVSVMNAAVSGSIANQGEGSILVTDSTVGGDVTNQDTTNGKVTLIGTTVSGKTDSGITSVESPNNNEITSSNGKTYTDLATALSDLPAGGTLYLGKGTFPLSRAVTIDKSVTLRGQGAENTIIQGVSTDPTVYFTVTQGNVVFDGMTFEDFGGEHKVGSGTAVIKVPSGSNVNTNLTVKNAVFENFNRAAIDIEAGEYAISGCSIDCNNEYSGANEQGVLTKGIKIGYGITKASGTIDNVQIKSSASTYKEWSASAIEVYQNGSAVITNTEINDCLTGIWVDSYYNAQNNSSNTGTSAYVKLGENVNISPKEGGDALIVAHRAKEGLQSSVYIMDGEYDGPVYIIEYTQNGETEYTENTEDNFILISGGRFHNLTPEDMGEDISYIADGYHMDSNGNIKKDTSSHSSSSSSDDPGSALPLAPGASYQPGEPSDSTQPGASGGFVSDTTNDLTVNGTYQFRITSLDGTIPFLTVDNANFRVEFASQEGNDFFFKIHAQGAAGSTTVVSVNGVRLLTATVGGSAAGVISDTTAPFTVKKGETYQFRLTASERPSFAAGSASFTVEYAGQIGSDYFYKVYAAGNVGDGCGFYINGEASPVAVATIA